MAAYISEHDIARAAWRISPVGYGTELDPKDYQRAPHVDRMGDALRTAVAGGHDRIIVTLPPRHSKPLADETPVLTTAGWKRHGDLKVGDEVFAPSGTPVVVTAVMPPAIDAMYRVVFSDGSALLAGAHHEWLVEVDRDCKRAACPPTRGHRHMVVRETRDLLGGYNRRSPFIAVAAPPELPTADLPIDPYVLGVWLGDGTSADSRIAVGAQDIDHFAALGSVRREKGDRYEVRPPGLRAALRHAGLLGNKHIPEVYFTASIDQRLALLQGLMDTDGCASAKGQCSFVSTREALTLGVRRLVESLGMKAKVATYRTSLNGRDCGPCWALSFYTTKANPCFRLARKVARLPVDVTARVGRRFIVAVEPVKPVPMRCITVEGGVYCAGEAMIATHNSETISHRTPLWFLDLFPERKVGLGSYEATFASEWGWKVRESIRAHKDRLRVRVHPDFASRQAWYTTEGGGMWTAGVDGAFTGRGFHLLIIDDPFKNWKEALSETTRDSVWNWYLSTAYSRLEPGGVVVVVQTRWHEDDLVGRLLKAQAEGGDEWHVINLPAIAEENDALGRPPGEALWPARFPIEALLRIKRVLGSYMFNALYQQRPAPPEGSIFHRGWWKRWRVMPSLSRADEVIQSWDMTFKDTTDADYVVGQVWGRWDGDFYLLDQVRDQMDFPTTVGAFRDLSAKWPAARAKLIEDAANGPAVIASLARKIPGIMAITPMGSKLARAHAVTPFCEAGNVYIPDPDVAPWIGDWVEESATFPNAAHDDQVDAMTQALDRLGASVDLGSEYQDERLDDRR